MTKGDCLSRLFDAYRKSASPGLMYYYEEWAKGLSVEMVSSIVDHVVKENSFLPTVNKLYEVSKERLGHTVNDEPEVDCWFCEGIGFIPGVYVDKQDQWTHGIISACKCSKGSRVASNHIPQINFEHDARYIDLMKVGKEFKESPWGAVVYFNARIIHEAKQKRKAEAEDATI